MENCFQFAAIRGVQAHRAFYVAMVPYGCLAKLLRPTSVAEKPLGRALNKARIAPLAEYIASHSDGHSVPPIHVLVGGLMKFEGLGEQRSVGTLSLDMTAVLHLVDGRHRVASIAAALDDRPSLARETLAVCFYPAAGKNAAREMYETLNCRAVRPTTARRRKGVSIVPNWPTA